MTFADPVPPSVADPARPPRDTGADGPASTPAIRRAERTGTRLTDAGTAAPGPHAPLAASCDHRSLNP